MRSRELRVEGRRVAIGERAFDILATLVTSAGKVVSKDDLLQRVWANAIVEENTLEAHLSALRKALGQDRKLLKTCYGRGYQLLGTWTVEQIGDAVPESQASDTAQQKRTKLPAASSPLIGRSDAVSHVCDLILSHRAVTITGMGGIGKTRLALEVAHRLSNDFSNGVCLVDLSTLTDLALVPIAVAQVLDVALNDNDHPSWVVAQAIGDSRMLLILDGCEHLLQAVSVLVDLVLRLCPCVTVLATSREILRVEGERVFRVSPLETSQPELANRDLLLSSSAPLLFLDRVRALGGGLDPTPEQVHDIAAICRQLDGLPLAIEFAAVRSATLGVAAVAAGLKEPFALLTVGRRTALPQHRTLRAVIDWSYVLLSSDEASTLNQLAVFVDSFTLAAATAIVGEQERTNLVTVIGELVNKSLLTADQRNGAVHYRLFGIVRLYALEKLHDSGNYDQVARRHAIYFHVLAERAGADSYIRTKAEWLLVYQQDLDNWRAALDWAFSDNGASELGISLTVAMLPIWLMLLLMAECRTRAEQALAAASAIAAPRDVMQLSAARALALFYTEKGAGPEVAATWTDVLVLADALKDSHYRLWAHWGLWNHQLNQGACRGALMSAQRFYQLAREPADFAIAERMIAVSRFFLGELDLAQKHIEGALARRVHTQKRSMMQLQFDPHLAARCHLPRILWLQGLPDQAFTSARRVVGDALESGHTLALSLALVQAGCPVSLLNGDLAQADRLVSLLLDQASARTLSFWIAEGRCFAGIIHVHRGNVAVGLQVFRAAIQNLEDHHTTMNATGYFAAMASALAEASDRIQAAAMVDLAFQFAERGGEDWCMPELLRLRGELMPTRTLEELSAVEGQFRRSLSLACRQGALGWELRTAMSLARVLRDHDKVEDASSVLRSVYDRFVEGYRTADLTNAKRLLDDLTM